MVKRSNYRYAPYFRNSTNVVVNGESSVQLALCSNALDQLPKEMLFNIFAKLKLEELANISQASRKLRDAVLSFLESNEFSQRLTALLMESAPSSMRTIYRRVGILLKRATCIMSTTKRLKVAEQFYSLNGPSDLVSRKAIANCWGALIKAFIKGWEYNECERVFRIVCCFGSRDEIGHLLNQFLNFGPGHNREHEKRLRTFFRSVFLDPHTSSGSVRYDDEFSFYLDLILREHSNYHQAKLIFLLFGPEQNGEVQWNLMCDTNIDSSAVFKEMGSAIYSLKSVIDDAKRSRSNVQLISLVEEITSYPDNWTLHNFSYLLDNCGDTLLSMVLSSRVINGRMREACEIFACLTLISAHNHVPMAKRLRLFIVVLNGLKSKSEQTALIAELVKTHYRRLGLVLSNTFQDTDFEDELSASELFYGEALRMAFNQSNGGSIEY